MSPAAKTTPRPNRRGDRKPVVIKQIGVDQWAGGLGHIKQMLVGGPDVGKTRVSSAYPRPLWLACEPLETVAASIASRKIDYEGGLGAPHIVEIESSDGLFDTLDWLDTLEDKKPPGGLPKYQTVILDTADGLANRLKNQWATTEGASVFAGRDAWAFLEGTFTLALERLLNLRMNVIVLIHLKDKDIEEPGPNGTTQKKTISELMLQGATKDKIVNDFNLIGLLKKEFVGDSLVRGISYDATAQFPFLKDHFNLTPPADAEIARVLGKHFWPITLDDGTKGGSGTPESFIDINYTALYQAIVGELDTLPEGGDVETIPLGGEPNGANVVAPGQGGPTPGAANVQPTKQAPPTRKAATPPAKAAAPASPPAAAPATPTASAEPSPPQAGAGSSAPSVEASTASTGGVDGAPSDADAAAAVGPGAGGGDGAAASEAGASVTDVADASVSEPGQTTAQPETPAAATTSPAEPTTDQAVAALQEGLGAEVVTSEASADAPSEASADQPAAQPVEGGCPICGKSMEKEQPDLVQLSRLKHRTLVLPDGSKFYDTGGCCYECYQKLNEEKASKTGLYAESA